MLQRDYIQRLIREFIAALQRFVEKKEAGERQEEARQMFTRYFGDYAFFHTGSIDDIMQWFERYPEEERLDRIGMLAELYYAEADALGEPMRTGVLDRAFMLFDSVDRHSRTFSIDRRNKLSDINIKRGRNPD